MSTFCAVSDPQFDFSRASLAEMVLHEDGRFRWNRVDNLLREGSKSSDLTSEQLWLLGSYLCSDAGAEIRVPLVEEVARLLDAYAAGPSSVVDECLFN